MSEVTYEMPEVTNMIIRSNDARLQMGNLKKGTPAVEAKEAEVDAEGKEISPAVAAKEAAEPQQTVYLIGRTVEIADEIMARMHDLGYDMPDAAAPVECNYGRGETGIKLT